MNLLLTFCCSFRGREFYCCGRPDGPKPQGRCDYFVWRYPKASDQPLFKKPRTE